MTIVVQGTLNEVSAQKLAEYDSRPFLISFFIITILEYSSKRK